MPNEKCLRLNKVVLVSEREKYIDLAVLAQIDPNRKNIVPVLSDSVELMSSRLLRWLPEVQIEEFHESKDIPSRQEICRALGLKPVNSWLELDAMDVYYGILKITKRLVKDLHYVVAFQEEPWSALMVVIRAAFDGRPFAIVSRECLGDLIAEHEISSVFIVTEKLDQEVIYSVHEQLSTVKLTPSKEPFPNLLPYGFLNANSFALMTFVDLKQRYPLPANDLDAIIVPYLERPPEKYEDCIIATRDTATTELFMETSTEIFSITGHGRSDLIFIGRNFLCGMSDSVSPLDKVSSQRVPSCMRSPYQCFRTDGDRLFINQLPARHVFVNSCGSLGVEDSEFGKDFNVSYAALEGKAESYVGTLRWKDGDIQESFLFRYLLRAGYSLGKTTVLLNTSLKYSHFESENDVFLLLGDPACTVVSDDDHLPNTIEVVYGSCITLSLKSSFQQVFFVNPNLAASYHAGLLNVSVKGDCDCYCAIYSARASLGEGVVINIMAPFSNSFPQELHVVLASGCDEFQKAMDTYNKLSIQHDPVLGIRKFYPTQVFKGLKNDLDNRIINLASLYKRTYGKPHLTLKLVQDSLRFCKLVENADKTTCIHLQKLMSSTNFRFSEHYQGTFLLNEQGAPKQRCYLCGQSVIVRSQNNIIRPHSLRNESICTRCGGLEDKPDEDFNIELGGAEAKVVDGKTVVSLTVVNNTENEQTGFGCVSIRNSERWGVEVDPIFIPYTMKPLEKVTCFFNVNIGIMPPHKHSLQAAFVNKQRVYLAMSPFWAT